MILGFSIPFFAAGVLVGFALVYFFYRFFKRWHCWGYEPMDALISSFTEWGVDLDDDETGGDSYDDYANANANRGCACECTCACEPDTEEIFDPAQAIAAGMVAGTFMDPAPPPACENRDFGETWTDYARRHGIDTDPKARVEDIPEQIVDTPEYNPPAERYEPPPSYDSSPSDTGGCDSSSSSCD